MPHAPAVQTPLYAKTAGTEPLPGYVLLEPLGRGGFGEVWKCEAPGGLHKAVKFVAGDPDSSDGGHQLRQESDAFEQIKRIRHPFLLTLERVEMVAGELVMVMELADRQLADRFTECRAAGLAGIPRGELLGYLADAAEALDVLGGKFGLQHLDVKPANLFLMDGHVKVGDYGLVSRQEVSNPSGGIGRGLTPRFVAPEVLRGRVDTRSDQYSLALVYQELLTGTFPYTAKNAAQMMMQHAAVAPDLSGLPPCDRPAVARALSKKPEDRFPSCREFAHAVLTADAGATAADPALGLRAARIEPPPAAHLPPAPGPRVAKPSDSTVTQNRARAISVDTAVAPPVVLPKLVASGSRQMPALVTVAPPPPPAARFAAPTPEPAFAEEISPYAVVLNPIRSVVPVARLLGSRSPADAGLSAADFAAAVVDAAAGGGQVPRLPGDFPRLADGTWVCRFPSTVIPAVAPLKLAVVREQWGFTLEQTDPTRVVLRLPAPSAGGLWGSFTGGKKAGGMKVVVQLPESSRGIGEVVVSGSVYGGPDAAFVRSSLDTLPRMLADVRRELANVDDRRRTARLAADFAVRVFPVHSNGGLDDVILGRCRDVSAGGVRVVAESKMRTSHAYVVFDGIEAVADAAALVKFVRSQAVGREYVSGGPYRSDL